MNQMNMYVDSFFDKLVIGADEHEGHHYKDYIQQSVQRFLQEETKENAYQVYHMFLDCYGYSDPTKQTDFISLLDKMRSYEENAATLTRKQRDHFVHSVNVFILGLCIYACNRLYRKAFYEACYKGQLYLGRRDTEYEEFFFRWGLAALCHDIGYPVEIVTNQINEFINFTTQLRESDARIYSHVEYDRFDAINSIPEHIKKRDFTHAYYDKYESCVYIDLLKPVDLLAHKLSLTLDVDLQAIKARLDGYVQDSGRSGRVDHGFFSAVILLKWFGYLIQISDCPPDMLYYPVLDSASAILLHNFYNIALVKSLKNPNPFSLEPLKPGSHPIAFLLMLCDELQEWNREPYGDLDRLRLGIDSVMVTLDNERMDMTYIVEKGTMPEEFIGKKVALFNNLLDLNAVFTNGYSIGCHTLDKLLIPDLEIARGMGSPLSMEQLERLAIAIHDRYNRMALKLNPQKRIKYPNFTDLPRERKYYNIRSAMAFPDMLANIGCDILAPGRDSTRRVNKFTHAETETLAALEHERWMRGKLERGWRYGAIRSKSEKTNPYMVPYAELPDEIKELDRQPVREILALLAGIGLAVYRREYEQVREFTADEIERMARVIHEFYIKLSMSDGHNVPMLAFDELTPDKQEANRRQARGIPSKMAHIGCVLLPKGSKGHGEPIKTFSPRTVEMLARIEHDEWTGEKVRAGWSYAPVRDDDKKLNPYMVPYDELSEKIKEYDRDAIRNIPALAELCGYEVFAR